VDQVSAQSCCQQWGRTWIFHLLCTCSCPVQ